MRYFLAFIVVIAAGIVGYTLGKFFSERDNKTGIIQNYSFVRDIAELASIEVTGTTSLNSSNVSNDGTVTDELKRLFIEKTVRLSAPFVAKYGVDLKDKNLRIEHNDSVLKVYLPPPKLLSYEIHLNRLEASNKKGWFQFQNEETYNSFQKKMYSESRSQLEKNKIYLNRSRDKICEIIQKYFAPLHVKTICIYDGINLVAPGLMP